jgi:D-alanyl-D-alanine dipeptidase
MNRAWTLVTDRHYSLSAFAGAAAALLTLAAGCARTSKPPHDLVDVLSVNPAIRLDMRYATEDNFTGRRLYSSARCFLRPAVAARLGRAQRELETIGRGLKVFDCYRPLSVQRAMWKIVPDERYVANPLQGSRHNRAAAVDLTLIDANGETLPMPTGYDDFSERAHREYMNLPASVILNRTLLERVMTRAGFIGLPTEWWHFDAADWEDYDLLDLEFDELD